MPKKKVKPGKSKTSDFNEILDAEFKEKLARLLNAPHDKIPPKPKRPRGEKTTSEDK